MKWAFVYGAGEEPRERELVFNNLFLHDPRTISEFYVAWKISDCRFKLRGKKIFYGKNLTRIRNEVGTITPPSNEQIGETNASLLRQPFDTIKKGRYLTNSLRNKDGQVNEDRSPIKVSEVLKEILENLDIDIETNSLRDEGDYVLENMIAEGEDIYKGLAEILRKNRMSLGINKTGKLFLYSIDFFDDGNFSILTQVQDNAKISPGRVYRQNLKNIRPKKVTILFEKLNEIRVIATNSSGLRLRVSDAEVPSRPDEPVNPQQSPAEFPFVGVVDANDIFLRRAISCINVIRVPFVPNGASGIFNIGEYVPLLDYLAVIGLEEDIVRKTWFNSMMEFFLKKQVGALITSPDPLVNMVAGAIRQHYRQVFMIDPAHMDNIKEMQDRRCTIIDNFSGTRPPSPLWADFCWFPRGRNIELARGQVVDKLHCTNVIVDNIDPNRERPTPGTIRFIDRDLGIFQVSYPPVGDTLIASIVPSALKEETVPVATPAIPGGSILLANSELKEEHTLETIVSAIWHYDKEGRFNSRESEVGPEAKYFDLSYDFQDQLGESLGPDIEVLSKKEYARVDTKGNLKNGEVLNAIAKGEAARIYNQFRDRFVGIVELPGFVEFPVTGNVKAVSFIVGPNSAPKTVVDMKEVPPSPDLVQILPDYVRRYAFKQIDPGGG